MPVTITPTSNEAGAYFGGPPDRRPCTAEDLLSSACRKEYKDCKELLRSSFPKTLSPDTPIWPTNNGFVNTCIRAYNTHHHLVIRPEDVWFAVLTQLSLYINKNAELLRGKFVAHEGKKELEVAGGGNRWTADYATLAKMMGELLQENVVDPELREWIMPDFSTTTKTDEVVASVIMMGAMQKYFDYKVTLLCGLPSVTLLGKQEDWGKLLQKIEKLKTFGKETEVWYTLLRPVLLRFVLSFEEPESTAVKDFWNRIAHNEGGGSGPTYYSGWITAFCFWDDKGKLLYKPKPGIRKPNSALSEISTRLRPGQSQALSLDGVMYSRIDTNDVAPGYTVVPVKIDDNGVELKSIMIAGSIGVKCSGTEGDRTTANTTLNTVQPESGWFIFEAK
ncbi:hypothetical protein MMC19_000243 [Ptychographa xylographoides]|nr:hypothetical protein [Ptychographa xylographoides]